MATLLEYIFASIGDKRNPPATDPTGAVNWERGYTPNYEEDLNSGDDSAKAVERDVMNYLFSVITENIIQYQRLGLPDWDAKTPNGYSKGAIVLGERNGEKIAFRSLTDNNTAPITATSSWDEIWTASTIYNLIGWPINKNYANSAIPGNIPNNIPVIEKNGLYISATQENADTLLWLPEKTPGILEVRTWKSPDGNIYKLNRYLTKDGVIYSRGYTNEQTQWRKSSSFNDSDIQNALNSKFNKNDVVQSLGSSTTQVISQKTSTDLLAKKDSPETLRCGRLNILPSTGDTILNIGGINGSAGIEIGYVTKTKQSQIHDVGSGTTLLIPQVNGTLGLRNTANNSASGHWICGDTGIIFQWGFLRRKDAITRIDFPFAFPNKCFNVQLTLERIDGANASNISVGQLTNSYFEYRASSPDLAGAFWFAIGW